MFQYGLSAAASAAKAHADACFNYATLQPGSCWHDTGSISWEGDNTEAYAEFFPPLRRSSTPMRATARNGQCGPTPC
jgi:hypothetical protein